MAISERRDHERIELQTSVRLWLDEKHNGKHIVFEGFARTRNIAIGGSFVESSYLLPVGFPINMEIQLEERGEILAARGQITHKLGESESHGPGMGVVFTAVDEENRERLLRFFISDRIRDFYDNRFVVEFPQLRNTLSLQDVALIVNLWEDREERLTALREAAGHRLPVPTDLQLPAPRRRAGGPPEPQRTGRQRS
jgi:hypothetical protein